jgi:3-methyladenine DNA glycosylase AlkC
MEGKQSNSKELDFLIKHTLRTLVKKGNIQALGLLGFNANPDIKALAMFAMLVIMLAVLRIEKNTRN